MTGKIIKAELGIIKKEGSSTKLDPRMEPLTLEKKFHTIHTKTFSVTGALVFVHQNSPPDPLDSNQSITNGNGLKLDKIDLPPEENNSPRSNSGPSSSYDAKTVILPGAVSDKRKLFEIRPHNNGDKTQSPIRWPTSKDAKTYPPPIYHNKLPVDSSPLTIDSGSRSGVAGLVEDESLTRFSTESFHTSLGKKTSWPTPNVTYIQNRDNTFTEAVQAQSDLFQQPRSDPLTLPPPPPPPPQSPPPSSRTQPPPSLRSPSPLPPPRTSSPELPSKEPKSPPALKPGQATKTPAPSSTEHQLVQSPRQTLGSPPPLSPPPPRSRQALVVRGLTQEPKSSPTPSSDQASPPLNSSSSDQLKPRQRGKLGATSSPQNQNPLNFFLDPTPIKIYSALTCGLACGALAAISVPAAPVVAGIAGIAAGGVVGYAIAEKISRDMEKKRNENNATRL